MLLVSQGLIFCDFQTFQSWPRKPLGARAHRGISGKQHWRLGERYLDGQTPVGSGCGHIAASARPSDSETKATNQPLDLSLINPRLHPNNHGSFNTGSLMVLSPRCCLRAGVWVGF